VISGALLVAASWQRWAAACPWSADWESRACETVQDHLYDFLPPVEPWAPVGVAAQLAGASLLVLAAALLLLPRRPAAWLPKPVLTVGVVISVLGVVDVGVATLRSGIQGVVVEPLASMLSFSVFMQLVPLVVAFLVPDSGRKSCLAAAVLLVLASPFVAAFTYGLGSFDARPWWEAVSGVLTVAAGLCLAVGAVRRPVRRPFHVVEPAAA